MPKFSVALLASASLFAFSAAHASTLPLMVVSASRSPLPLDQIASSMTVITAEEIERDNRATVVDLLRRVPGVTVANNGGAGQQTRVFLRGTNSNHVLVLIDGVAVNDPSSPDDAFDFSNLTTDNLERIEILRGPQSTVYGSQAIGGVINLISRKGEGAPQYDALAEYGRYNSTRLRAGVRGEAGATSYSLTAGGFRTDGISAVAKRFGGYEKDGNDTYTLAMNLAQRIGEYFTARLDLRYNRTNTEFDTPNSFLFPTPRPVDDPLPENDSRQFNGRASGELKLLDGKWTQELGVSYLNLGRTQITEFYDSSFGVYFGHQQFVAWREKIDWVHRIRPVDAHAVTLGAELSSDHYKLNGIPQIALPELNVDNHAFFIDDHMTIADNLFLNAGVRNDYHQSFGRSTTWKLAPVFVVPATATRLKATYGTGFKAPSLYSLYDSTFGNPSLNPERSRGWDAGFEQPLMDGALAFGATWFHNDIKNLFDTVEVAPGIYRYANIGKARTQGLETTFSWTPAAKWQVDGSYTFTQADNQLDDVRLVRRPRHQASLAAVYQYGPEGDVGVNLRYVGSRPDSDLHFVPTVAKAFATVDLSANYKLTESATVYGRLENLLDKRYSEIPGYGQPGRSLIAGVKTRF